MIKIFHAKNMVDGLLGFSKWPEEYEEVAHVMTDDLDKAFELTNSISAPWWLNPDVIPADPMGHRSTSVGDIAVVWDGNIYRCASSGWVEIKT